MRVWLYEATCLRHIDGDTSLMDIDQGMNHWARNQYIRYAGINAPEMHGATKPAAEAALAYLETLLPAGAQAWLATVEYHEFEKYGRVLAYVYTAQPATLDPASLMAGSVNQAMLDSGNAVSYAP